jgi:hypothetical protein
MRLDARGKAAAGVDGNRAVKLEWHGDGEDSADFSFSKAIVEKSEFPEYRRVLTEERARRRDNGADNGG